MDLEVDHRNDLPIPYQKYEDEYSIIQAGNPQASHAPPIYEKPQQSKLVCGLRPATLILSIALAIMTVLAVLAAGVGGFLAAKNKYAFVILSLGAYIADISPPRSHQSVSSTVPSASNSSCPATNSTSSNTTSTSFQPTGDCEDMRGSNKSPFDLKFNLLCEMDLGGHDLVGVFVYYFRYCIEACAGFNNLPHLENETCYGVTYDIAQRPSSDGNCFLKNSPNTSIYPLSSASSAQIAYSK